MKVGFVGLAGAGKTTLFRAVTRTDGQGDPFRVIDVPDARVDRLTEIFSPKKKTYAKVTVHDLPGIGGDERSEAALMANLRDLEALAIVLRGFESPTYPYPRPEVDVKKDLEQIISSFQLADFVLIEKRIEKLEVSSKKPTKDRDQQLLELDLLKRMKEHLEGGGRLEELQLNEKEDLMVRGFRFLTQKPALAILSLPDEGGDEAALRAALPPEWTRVIALRGAIEAGIAELEGEDAELFMQEYGIEQPARDQLISAMYDLLGLHSFYTAGEDECRAWTIKRGDDALEAAGAIHSDIQRGFIRAEVIPYEALVESGGFKEAKANNHMRLEGKDYVVQEAEVIHFRFNV